MPLPTITGVGRLTADPELRFSPNGTAVCKVRLAFNSRRKNEQTGQWEDSDVFYVDGTVFKQEAEHVAETLERGFEVVVTGRLKTRQWEKDGEKRSTVELMIDAIGPALKSATAKVRKMSRDGGDSNGSGRSGGGDTSPWAGASTGGSGGGSFDSEPPF